MNFGVFISYFMLINIAICQHIRYKPKPNPKQPSEESKITPETASKGFDQISPPLGSKLPKRVSNDSTRLLFFAGLEGSGHNTMEELMLACIQLGKCEKEEIIGGATMRYDEHNMKTFGLFGAAGGNDVMEEVAVIENRMNDLLKMSGNHLYYIGLKSHKGGGTMVYPNFGSKDKALNNPDIFSLAMIAESVGIDLRIIVLQSSASDIMNSVYTKGFSGIKVTDTSEAIRLPKIMLTSAAALYTQLSLLDKKFFECIRESELNSLTSEQKSKLVNFIHPTNINNEILDKMLKSAHHHRRLQLLDAPVRKFNDLMLAHLLSLIDNVCQS